MFTISLKNNKSFNCDANTTVFQAAKEEGIQLEHSCLAARCRSCSCKVVEGTSNKIMEDSVLTEEDNKNGIILTCNATPTSDMVLDIEDLGDVNLQKSRTLPAKIDSVIRIADKTIKVVLRLPPTSNFKFEAGQYINILKGTIKRSYSIANGKCSENKIELFIKEYENGVMSNYWFKEAKQNDLLRIEGPLGTFFYKENELENIIFLATGTGIAPVNSILEQLEGSIDLKNKRIWLFWGNRYEEDFFQLSELSNNIIFVPVLSRPKDTWSGATGYVQDGILKQGINLTSAQVYACGSINMITSAKELCIENSLPENQFFSDAFVSTN